MTEAIICFPGPSEVMEVGGARYLRLVDGRGWIFETKDDTSVFTEVPEA